MYLACGLEDAIDKALCLEWSKFNGLIHPDAKIERLAYFLKK